MAIIPQQRLFGWEEIEELNDLKRLQLALEYMPDEEIMEKLEEDRGNGRDDYPIRGMWNAIIAGIIFQHISVERLRRELKRNGQLRYLCGLSQVPTASAFSRFIKKLFSMEEEINTIFDRLVEDITTLLPGFGTNLAIDGKAIQTVARPHGKNGEMTPDGRRDTDADFGKKVYKGQREDGTTWEKAVKWFGYKLHLIVDADYELPVAFSVTTASAPEAPQAHKLLDQLNESQPGILQQCDHFLGDKGYDDGKLIKKTWDEYGIKPIIDIRSMWKDEDKTRLLDGTTNIVYNYCGTVYCHCMETGTVREMAYGGFEKDRETLKYRCPAEHYGINCQSKESCPVNGSLRIKIEEDRRIFTPVARSSYKWKTLYNKRTSVERVNSRLDVSFGFENHYIRGLKKMKLRLGLAFCVMLAMALGRIKENQMDNLRSLVKAA